MEEQNISRVAKAHYSAKKVMVLYSPDNLSDALLLGTLQGILANKSQEQIMFAEGAYVLYQVTHKHFSCKALYRDKEGRAWNASSLLSYFAHYLDGYILTDTDPQCEGSYVAVTLAAMLNAVVVTTDNRHLAEQAGLGMLLDARELTDGWLRSSPYWEHINRDVAVEQPLIGAPKLVDYAVMAGAYFSFYNGTDAKEHSAKYGYLNSNAIVYGWNSVLGEHDTVMSFGSINACLVPADHAYNLSTLSGFELEQVKQCTKDLSEKYGERKHTVCFVMSDGDNLQWFLNGFALSENWYASSHRGKFSLGWGMTGTALDTASPMVKYVYDRMTREDEFIMQLSGIGYTFPSLWDKAALEDMARELSENMERMDLKYAEILDDNAFESKNFDPFTKQNGIDGIFYIDYWNYAGMKGEILWSKGKPVVSAKYRLWADLEDGQIGHIVDSINASSTDPSDKEAYTFVTVHCWSGLDKDGRLVPDGNTVDAVKAVIDRLSSHVDVVTPSEFMTRIIANLSPEN